MEQKDLLKEIISHCKEYGYVFPSSEIYDGLAATYDYGQLGAELKNNIKTYWWKSMTQLNSNIVGIDSAIFMHPTTWKASGHVDAFNDPLIDNKDSKKRYRADVLLEEYLEKQNQKIQKEVDKYNLGFGNWEQIKKFELLPKEFSIDAGEMTPKLSLKRKVILQKYEPLILKIYDYKNTSL